jgi:hypothetical protein
MDLIGQKRGIPTALSAIGILLDLESWPVI